MKGRRNNVGWCAAVVATLTARHIDRVRIVLSGAAPTPWHMPEAERVVVGQRPSAGVACKAGAVAVKGAEPLANNAYKVELLRGTVEEALLAIA